MHKSQLIAPNLTSFLDIIQAYFPSLQRLGWCYRGHSKTSWELKPKAGRKEYFDPTWGKEQTGNPKYQDKDIGRFEAWRNEAVAFIKELPENSLECLALAQHHGLATRLLDWTQNSLVALFFACKEYYDFDGCVYAYLPKRIINSVETDLNKIETMFCYQPKPFNQRIHNQRGIFTYHPHPETALKKELVDNPLEKRISKSGYNLEYILIPKGAKTTILGELYEVGIDASILFLGLDGLSELINWGTMEDVDGI